MSLRPLVFVCLISFLGLGCGDGRPKRVPVMGQVFIDGVPLTHGTIQVIPEGDRAAFGEIRSDGTFDLTTFDENDGCVPGKHKVAVVATETIDAQSQRWHAPKKYMSPETSGLTVEITDPPQPVVIELTWDGGKPFVERFNAE